MYINKKKYIVQIYVKDVIPKMLFLHWENVQVEEST